MKSIYFFLSSSTVIYFAKVAGAFLAVIIVFNLTWGYAQEKAFKDSGSHVMDASRASDPVIKIEELPGKKVMLSWAVDPKKSVSHFVVERSTDGKLFTDAAMLFTDDMNDTYEFNYLDNLTNFNSSVIYYRLKVVDKGGSFTNTTASAIKWNTIGAASAQVSY